MKRKIAKALTCISILSLMMTGCGNAVTTNAEPVEAAAFVESETETGGIADNGQKTDAGVGAGRVSDSTVVDNNKTAADETTESTTASAADNKVVNTLHSGSSGNASAASGGKSVASDSAADMNGAVNGSSQDTGNRVSSESGTHSGSSGNVKTVDNASVQSQSEQPQPEQLRQSQSEQPQPEQLQQPQPEQPQSEQIQPQQSQSQASQDNGAVNESGSSDTMTPSANCTADPDKIAADREAAEQRLAELAAAEQAAAEKAAAEQAAKEQAEREAAEAAANVDRPIGRIICECGWYVEIYPGRVTEAEDALIAHQEESGFDENGYMKCGRWTEATY